MSKSKQNHFLQLYKPVHVRFERFCRARAITEMPYEDLMNETLLVAFKRMNEIKKEKSFLSFLIGISLRILANANRKKRPSYISENVELNNLPDPENQFTQQSNSDLLYKALAKLPPLQREAIILFELTGFSIKEIVAIQKSGESAVKQRLVRGRKALATILKKEMLIKN